MMDAGAPARRSTSRGRSIEHTARVVLGAPRRMATMVEPAPLLSLRNTLAHLMTGAPALDGLAESANRVLGVDAGQVGRRRSGPPQDPGRRPATTAPRLHETVDAGRSAMVGRLTRSTPQGESPDAPDPGIRPQPPTPERAAQPSRAPEDGIPTAPHVPEPETVPDAPGRPGVLFGDTTATPSGTSSAPVNVVRTEDRRSPEPPERSSSTGPGTPLRPRPESPGLASPEHASTTTTRTPTAGPFDVDAAVGMGALGELVGRWSQPTSLPDLSRQERATPAFASASASGFSGSAFDDRLADGDRPDVSLDRVQLALGELLRREAEQHGLDGGLR